MGHLMIPVQVGLLHHLKKEAGNKHHGTVSVAQGDTIEAFEEACFSKDTKLGEPIGPVQTRFGYHLIWLEESFWQATPTSHPPPL